MAIKPIYEPLERPMRVAFLFTEGGSAAFAAIEDSERGQGRGLYEVVGGATNNPQARGIRSFRETGKRVEIVARTALEPRDDYSGRLYKAVSQYRPDIIMLAGFMEIVRNPLLAAYYNRILNVHPADPVILADERLNKVSLPGADGYDHGKLDTDFVRREIERQRLVWRYSGADAVVDAVLSGENHVMSTVHIAREEVDSGPVLLRSKRLPVDRERVDKWLAPGRRDITKVVQYARLDKDSLQNRMKVECDGPAFTLALRMIAEGRFGLNGDVVYLDSEKLPFGGFKMGD